MGQQLGIIVLIDIAGAVEANDLHGHLWFVDNGRWDGSTGEGTGNLVTALDVTDADIPVLNWLPLGIGTVPVTVPQTFFLYEDDRRALSQPPLPAKHPQRFPVRIRNILGDEVNIKQPAHLPRGEVPADPAMPFSGQGFLDPGPARFRRTGQSRVARPGDQDVIHYPDPAIQRIGGEAVEQGVIFPAQYGSPELFSDGLYWSASVDPNVLGVFRYTLWITLCYSRRDGEGRVTDHSVTLPHDAWIKISRGALRSGFSEIDFNMISA
jgi:hypothetical protein